jgi:calcineurin-like phosphoesterase family protein
MNVVLYNAMAAVDAAGDILIHGGDFSFQLDDLLVQHGPFLHPENHILVKGNHDRNPNWKYQPWFGTVIGTARKWRSNRYKLTDRRIVGDTEYETDVIVSHEVQPLGPTPTINLYGHHHNNRSQQTPQHWPISAELLNYRPHTLLELRGSHG